MDSAERAKEKEEEEEEEEENKPLFFLALHSLALSFIVV